MKKVLSQTRRNRSTSRVDMNLGRRVRARRKELDLTQVMLGEKLGVSYQQIQKYENGSTNISSTWLRSLAAALDISVESLLGKQAWPGLSIGSEFLATAQGLGIARAFLAIDDPRMRKAIADLLSVLAKRHRARNEKNHRIKKVRSDQITQ